MVDLCDNVQKYFFRQKERIFQNDINEFATKVQD